MHLTTASQVVNFARELEDKSAKLYEDLAQVYEEHREAFLSLARENKKNKLRVQRAYTEFISDALETGFSFKGLNPEDYSIKTELIEGKGYSGILKRVTEIEENIQEFYLEAAKQSESFLADVARAFEMMAKKRVERRLRLRSLQGTISCQEEDDLLREKSGKNDSDFFG